MIWSFSKIKAFENCQRMFIKKYIEKAAVENEESEILKDGAKFHEESELFYEQGIKPKRMSDWVADKLRAVFSEIKAGGYEVYKEQMFYLTDDMRVVTSPVGEEVWFMGVADLVSYNDEELVVIEYKSGRREVSEEQVILYAMAFYNGQERIRGFTVTPFDFIEVRLDPNEVIDMVLKIKKRIDKIERELNIINEWGEIKANPGSSCLFCQWRESCPALKVRADIKEIVDKGEVNKLADMILGLELKLEELKGLAKSIVEMRGEHISTSDGTYGYGFKLSENIIVDPLEVVRLCKDKGINPFEVMVPGAKKPKSLLKVDTQALRIVEQKLNLGLGDLLEVKVVPRFEGFKIKEGE